ncbi:MAG: M14 family metallopeptidase [Bacteroidetes bacterium]|nr:M14 family metallopeptidase [Bacteroidota bacterium]
MRKFPIALLLFLPLLGLAQSLQTPFELSEGRRTATYYECIDFYKRLDAQSPQLSIKEMGLSDAGYPYHVLLFSNDGVSDPAAWHRKGKLVFLINNGIHPGEPDGIDASMLLLRDLVTKKIHLPDNIALAVIPLYNIGGALNRGPSSRVNQNGPETYGFRGNAQNLDLNRDFTKCDSRDAQSFSRIFHWVDPDIQIDNHVSDGADYQYTMTLLSSQWNKLGGELGTFLHETFQPALFAGMEKKGWGMTPYVDFEQGNPGRGWEGFYDEPRYSSGYATLFHTMAFMPETHMLKPFKDRVHSTYALMQTMIEEASLHRAELLEKRKKDIAADLQTTRLALDWKVDTTRWDMLAFKGYEAAYKPSEVTGAPRLYYDHSRPFDKPVRFYNYFTAAAYATVPSAYIIPQGWHSVTDLLALNGVTMRRLTKDSVIKVTAYHIADYRSSPHPYEKHHRNTGTSVVTDTVTIQFLRGDFVISTNQPARRFLVEMLEPTGEDSYFAWNFFDAILQQKEGYSAYRWEDVAGPWLAAHPEVKALLEEKKRSDSIFAHRPSAQLDFVYKHSPWYEPAHLRYPVYRLD